MDLAIKGMDASVSPMPSTECAVFEYGVRLDKDAEHAANEQIVLARRLYNMTGDIVMSLLILDDATKAPEMFQKSANVYVRMAEEEVLGHSAYIQNFKAEDLESFKA